jgi:hypothetical protein
MSNPPKRTLLWWILPGVIAGMPMPFKHPTRSTFWNNSQNECDCVQACLALKWEGETKEQ